MKVTSEAFNIAGPAGQIEAILDRPAQQHAQYISVNCHPHSLHGGSMTNKVVHTISRSIASLGIPSIRFNFRGVGQSDGEYDDGIGEQADLVAVSHWMTKTYPQAKLILSGFSFGSFVSAFASTALQPKLLISVAPPVKRVSFEGFNPPECIWKVIMGTDDELVDYSSVKAWVEDFNPPPGLITMEGASHFFHGRLLELRCQIETIINSLFERES